MSFNRRALRWVSLPLAVFTALISSCSTAGAPAVGSEAPSFELFDLNSSIIRLSDYLGRPVVVNFWGTQCVYCIEEMPDLEAAFRQESAKVDGAVFLTVNVQDSSAKARAFMNSNGYTLPVLMDAGGRVARAYQVSAIPVTFFIDRTGTIRYVKFGMFLSLGEINAVLETIR